MSKCHSLKGCLIPSAFKTSEKKRQTAHCAFFWMIRNRIETADQSTTRTRREIDGEEEGRRGG